MRVFDTSHLVQQTDRRPVLFYVVRLFFASVLPVHDGDMGAWRLFAHDVSLLPGDFDHCDCFIPFISIWRRWKWAGQSPAVSV